MPVPDVVEEVQLGLVREESGADGMHGSIAPSLVVEPALAVKVLEEVDIGRRPPQVQRRDLKVRPDCDGPSGLPCHIEQGGLTVASVVLLAVVVANEFHGVVRRNVLRVHVDELCSGSAMLPDWGR